MAITLAVFVITILAVISPGADFAMITRNSLLFGRTAGLYASLGIAAGVQLHVLYTMLGVGLVLQTSPQAFLAVKAAGALYLIYIGYRTFVGRPGPAHTCADSPSMGKWGALRSGFFTNALNPKTTLFVVSVYTQVVQPGTPLGIQLAYGLMMSVSHWVWFSLVSVFFSEPVLRQRMLKHQVLVNQVIGAVLAALGGALALSSFEGA